MRWEAHTNYASIGVGTAFTILATPQVEGQAPDVLPSGVDLDIDMHGNWIRAKVISATKSQAVIELPGGQQWTMTPATNQDHFPTQVHIDMHTQDWIIRK